jgi:hypothetical protein
MYGVMKTKKQRSPEQCALQRRIICPAQKGHPLTARKQRIWHPALGEEETKPPTLAVRVGHRGAYWPLGAAKSSSNESSGQPWLQDLAKREDPSERLRCREAMTGEKVLVPCACEVSQRGLCASQDLSLPMPEFPLPPDNIIGVRRLHIGYVMGHAPQCASVARQPAGAGLPPRRR